MFDLYRKLFSLFDPHERRRGGLVLVLLVIMAFVDVLGVASVMPFIAVLANPEIVETNRYLKALHEALPFESQQAFLLFLGVGFLMVLICSLALRAIGLWAQFHFSNNRDCAWSVRLVGRYLRQPYEWFLNRHSSDLATAALAEVGQVVVGALFPAMQVIAHVLVASFLGILLLIVDPLLAVSVCGGLVGCYVIVSLMLKSYLTRIAVERQAFNKLRFHAIQEAFGGIKDVKVGGHENVFLDRFRVPASKLAKLRISFGILSELPSFAMQALLFGGMLLLLLYLMAVRGGFSEAVPIVALYAFAGYRLMPAIQGIYRAVSEMRYSKPALDSLCADLAVAAAQSTINQDHLTTEVQRIPLDQRLELVDVSYSYPGTSTLALESLTINVPANFTVGLVGSTGSGKTTVVDILLGLLRPTTGVLSVDGVHIVDQQVRRWQRSLGYVPQQIYLSDDTVAANIAFGCRKDEIDMAAVAMAASIANLHDFVINQLPNGYSTQVGERGIRLSGGQRQRIGIARALYHDPDVLILDEATSALDNLTEHAVMDALQNLGRQKTIIIVAHRLSTVRNCDRIYLLERGSVASVGTFDQLLIESERFRAMAELA